MLLIGLSTFILGLLLAGFGQELFGRTSAGANTFSRSLVGHKAFVDLVKRSGLAVVVSKNAESSRANRLFRVMLLEPVDILKSNYIAESEEALPDKNRQDEFSQRIDPALKSGARVVLALPKRWARVSEIATGWIGSEKSMKIEVVQRMLSDALLSVGCMTEQPRSELVRRVKNPGEFSAAALGLGSVHVDVDGPMQLLANLPESTPLVFSDQGVVLASMNCGLILVSDPDLFNNRSLARADNPVVMLALLEDYLNARGIVVDETFHGFKAKKSILAYALTFPLVLVSIHFLLAMFLAFWAMSGYFGKPLATPSAISPGKSLLIDNTARLLLDGGDRIDTLKRYSSMVMTKVARGFGTSPGVEALQELSKSRGVQIDLEKLLIRCRSAHLTQAEAVRLARKFYLWARAVQGYKGAGLARRGTRRGAAHGATDTTGRDDKSTKPASGYGGRGGERPPDGGSSV